MIEIRRVYGAVETRQPGLSAEACSVCSRHARVSSIVAATLRTFSSLQHFHVHTSSPLDSARCLTTSLRARFEPLSHLLTDAKGKTVSLYDKLKKHFAVVLCFYRSNCCLQCLGAMRKMQVRVYIVISLCANCCTRFFLFCF